MGVCVLGSSFIPMAFIATYYMDICILESRTERIVWSWGGVYSLADLHIGKDNI